MKAGGRGSRKTRKPAAGSSTMAVVQPGSLPEVEGVLEDPKIPLSIPAETPEEAEIVRTLNGYWDEADTNRKGGLNPRDAKWKENVDLYWNRHDFSKKAIWQAKETLPEVPGFVDRFAAAMKDAMVASPDGFYTVVDPADKEHDVSRAIKRGIDVWLSKCGRNMNGNIIGFPAVFEEQIKLGTMMAMCATVTWKKDVPGGRVAVDGVDPRMVWLDHTGRSLYRIRRVEVDKHELLKMAQAKDGKGKPLFNLPELSGLVTSLGEEDKIRQQELSGSGGEVISSRTPVVLDEYLATVVGPQGNLLADKSLCVVANKKFLVRGPEKNPFLHGKDWLLYAPLVTAPLSIYGRSYMEDLGSIARTFNELTNALIDAVRMSAMKAFVVVPSMLLNPGQLAEGISPNKMFQLEEGNLAGDFLKEIDLGSMPQDAMQFWSAIKSELREAFGLNEVGLGQFAPKGRTSASEIMTTQQSSSGIVRSVAETVETTWLEPCLDLVWQTGMQHVGRADPAISAAMGEEMFKALLGRRKELIGRPITFQARGISTLIQKGRQLKVLLQILQVIATDQTLMQEFLKIVDLQKLIKVLFEWSDIDLSKLQIGERDKMIREIAEPLGGAQQQAQQQGSPAKVPGEQGVGGQVAGMVNAMGGV